MFHDQYVPSGGASAAIALLRARQLVPETALADLPRYFFGYAGYYLVRKNFSLAMPYLVEQGYSRGDLGFAMSGVAIAYGISNS